MLGIKTESEILGKWKRVSTHGLGELRAAAPIGSMLLPTPGGPLEFTFSKTSTGDWLEVLSTDCGTTKFPFKSGHEFQIAVFRGKAIKSTITIEGNKLSEIQHYDGKSVQIIREFDGERMHSKFTADESKLEASEEFHKIK